MGAGSGCDITATMREPRSVSGERPGMPRRAALLAGTGSLRLRRVAARAAVSRLTGWLPRPCAVPRRRWRAEALPSAEGSVQPGTTLPPAAGG